LQERSHSCSNNHMLRDLSLSLISSLYSIVLAALRFLEPLRMKPTGYGDLTMPVDMRWFQIFYTTLGTVLVGSVFGGIASLSQELQDLKRFYAWERREVSKRLLEDMQGENSDGKIDQYEFLVGSLLVLNKLERSDIDQIMDKFRQLAGDKGYIDYVEETADEIGMENVTSTREGNEAEDLTMDIDDVKQTFR